MSEHDDRLLCAACLRRDAAIGGHPVRDHSAMMRGLGAVAGLAMACLFFYGVGSALASFDNEVHGNSPGQKFGVRP